MRKLSAVALAAFVVAACGGGVAPAEAPLDRCADVERG
jgi:hypothetical protein